MAVMTERKEAEIGSVHKPDSLRHRSRPVIYPTSDGKPMAETDRHADIMSDAKNALRAYYQPQAHRVYVSGNNYVFWREGRPHDRVSPDVYVVFDVEQKQRDSYMAWMEGGKLPAFVLEVTSRKTKKEDEGTKFMLYEQNLKVPEYFQFDPTGDYLSPRLQGFRLVEGHYQPLPLETDSENRERIWSEQLGLWLVTVERDLRFLDPKTGKYLPKLAEAEARANAEAEARAKAEAEIAKLRAELARLRGEQNNQN